MKQKKHHQGIDIMGSKLHMFLIIFFCAALSSPIAIAQTENEVLDLKDPITGKWGYASKVQNRKSPLKGVKKLAVSTLGKAGSAVMSKSDAEAIDWVIPPLYDAVSPNFSEQLAAVEVGGLVGYIDVQNRFVIDPQFEPMKNMDGFSLGLAAVRIGAKYGYINKRGETVIAPQFDYAENFKKNMLATIKQDGKFGAIDLAGHIVVPCKYPVEAAMTTVPFSNKLYRHASDSVKQEFDKHTYDEIWSQLAACDSDILHRITDSLWIQPLVTTTVGDGAFKGVKDNYNRQIVPCSYTTITYDADNHLYVVTDSLNRCGLYTYKGNRLFHPLFDSMADFVGGQSTVTVCDIEGQIDSSGWVDPEFMDKICNTGLQYDTEGNTIKARNLYERILTIDPNHVMALNNLAIIDINNKDYNKGLKKLKLAHSLAPDNSLISENLHQAKKNRNERRWNRVTTGLEIAAAIITLGAATYSAVNGVDASSSSLSTAGSMSSTSSNDGASSSSGNNGDKKSSKSNLANWRALDRSYDGYESTLMRMSNSGNVDKQEVRRIQSKMKDIRKKIYEQSGGHQKAVSSWENWNP